DVLVPTTIRVAANAFTDWAAGRPRLPTAAPPASLIETVRKWLGGSPCLEPAGVEETIPLVLLAGVLHHWPLAEDRWLDFVDLTVVEVRRALPLDGQPFDEGACLDWLDEQVGNFRRPGPDPSIDWLEELYWGAFDYFGREAPERLPPWWPMIVGTKQPAAGGGDFVEEECQGHPALRDGLLQLGNYNVPLTLDGDPLSALRYAELRYRNVSGALAPTPTSRELASRLTTTAENIDQILSRVRRRLLAWLEAARQAGRLCVSARWMKRVLPSPLQYTVAWPLDLAGADVGLFAWTLPSPQQLEALVAEEDQGEPVLRQVLEQLATRAVPLSQDVSLSQDDPPSQNWQAMTALEFVHACYRNRLDVCFCPPSPAELAAELTASGFVLTDETYGPVITAEAIRDILNQVREQVADWLDAARRANRLTVPKWWPGVALPEPAQTARGQLFYPLPGPNPEAPQWK
ncbi:MAG TPA: hypothetical protein VFE78_34610, partial [Gemmataceae bacterium]|nr:hypothetical protein [Gemmataceae bacterium]